MNPDTFEGVAITIHHATRLDQLAWHLGELLDDEPPAPFEMEMVAVPTRGIQRWLDQMLSHRLGTSGENRGGISAGIDYRSPRSLVELFLPPGDNRWEPSALAWTILKLVDEGAEAKRLLPLRQHLEAAAVDRSGHGGRRYPVARRIAGLFAAYASERPGMLRAWLAGEETDGAEPLEPDLSWQAHLFRALVASLGAPPHPLREQEALELAHSSGITRFHAFGHTRLTQADLEFLAGAEASFDVHLWLPHPSPEQWSRTRRSPQVERSTFESAEAVDAPLLHTFGAQSRELVSRLNDALPHARTTWTTPASPQSDTLLERLHSDVQHNRPPAPGAQRDDTVQIHACHGPSRQVEVLREVLTGLFEQDPNLQPRDVLILCPDVDTYAPLFRAAFGSQEGHPGRELRVRIADRNHAATNPLFDLARMLLSFVGGRIRSTELLDLVHRTEVQRRFRISDTDVETLTYWIKESGIRWGLDLDHRERFDLKTAQNTIQAGLDRLLLGVVLPEGDPLAGVLPHGDIGSTEIELLGVFAEFLNRLRRGITTLDTAETLTDWVSGLGGLLAAIAKAEDWQESELARGLATIAESGDVRASRADVLEMIEDLTRPRFSSANLRTGALTVASLLPMRSVPHKVVCLVGMDDGDFPRVSTLDGDDVLTRRPLVGERQPRYEDRQLFLDSIMSATEKLVITFSGAGEQRGEELYPAVPVAQLLDTLSAMTSLPANDLITTHPLHPFDHRYFSDDPSLVSFDARAATAAQLRRSPLPHPPFLSEPVPSAPAGGVTLRELHNFFADPVRNFIQEEAGVRFSSGEDLLPTAIPISVESLDAWRIGERLLNYSKEHGWDARDLGAALLHGDLPPGALGTVELEAINGVVTALCDAAAAYARGPATAIDIDVRVPGIALRGRVNHVYGDHIVHVSYSTLAPKHRFAAWLDLLALTVQHPDRKWTAVVVGRDRKKAMTKVLSAPDPRQAETLLADLLDLRARGMQEPLPLPPKTAAAWAKEVVKKAGQATRAERRELISKVAGVWETDRDNWANEDKDRYQVLAWGRQLTFAELLDIAPRDDEAWGEEPSRLGQLAMRMWERMLDHEV